MKKKSKTIRIHQPPETLTFETPSGYKLERHTFSDIGGREVYEVVHKDCGMTTHGILKTPRQLKEFVEGVVRDHICPRLDSTSIRPAHPSTVPLPKSKEVTNKYDRHFDEKHHQLGDELQKTA